MEKEQVIYLTWLSDFEKWIGSCYPEPSDRIVKTNDKICLNGISYNTFNQGLKDSESMWKDFVLPLLREYKKSEKYDEEVHSQVY